jgi:NAD(P)-dependent dehydrogenase (short-subunit alcohol dehydrogenase family)
MIAVHSGSKDNMPAVVAVIAPGAMGAAVGRRLVERGAKVVTSLAGRSAGSVARAREAGMLAASEPEIAAADFVLSILPPGEALPLAEHLAPALTASNRKPVYVDCNAINPATVERVAAAIARTGCVFVDAGIIGAPPKPPPNPSPKAGEGRVGEGPRFYASGPAAARFAALVDYGLDVRVLDGPLTAASALKMSYAGITKGTQALGAAMMLAAMRSGSAAALFAELEFSQKDMLAFLAQQLAIMPPKAYRWVAEMQEIAGFVGADPAAHELYVGAAHFYQRIAADFAGEKADVSALMAFLDKDFSRGK